MGFRILSDDEMEQLAKTAPDIHPGRMVVYGSFVAPDNIAKYTGGHYPQEETAPQPVSMSPGALGVKVGE